MNRYIAVLGCLAVLSVGSVAKADCGLDGISAVDDTADLVVAIAQSKFCHTPVSGAVRGADGHWQASCGYNDLDWDLVSVAEERCDLASQGWIEDGLTEEQVGGHAGMYGACMRLSVPPMVLTPAQHYDTSDGAFWRTGGAL